MNSSTTFSGHYVVCARMGDGFYRTARARLIWAAQTAQATMNIGVPAMLTASVASSPFDTTKSEAIVALKRTIAQYYNVEASFKTLTLFPKSKDNDGGYGREEADLLFPRYVAPFAAVVHTRDPRIVRHCVRSSTPVVYEDHNEDYHIGADLSAEELNHSACRGVVAITETVAHRLEFLGVDKKKILVLDSGVNQRAFAPPSTRSDSFREYLLSGGRSSVAVYTGGLQRERGIQSILEAAERMPATQFGLAGGTRADIDSWVNLANARHINNITFFGYLPQDEAIALQRAADVLLMTRAPGHRASISSPLKFFEYLASGVPVVAAETPVLERFKQSELGVVWYKPDEYGDFLNALSSALDRNAEIRAKSQHNISLATNYSWEVRQKSIFKAFELDQFF